MSIRALAMLAVLGGVAEAGPFVRWHAPAECPDATDVEQRVARRLGPDVRAAAPIDVTVRADDAGFAAEIGDARTLTSTSCTELADAAALVVARLVLEAPAPQPSITAPAIVAERISPPARPITHERTFAIGARLSVVSGIGAQPGLGIGGELAVPLRWRTLFVEPAIATWTSSATSDTAAGVEAALRDATLRIGWHVPAWPVRAWLVADAGELRGQGVQVMGARSESPAWAGVGAGAAITWRVERNVAILGTAELVVALLRPRFALADGELLYQPSAVAPRLALGVEVSWP